MNSKKNKRENEKVINLLTHEDLRPSEILKRRKDKKQEQYKKAKSVKRC